MYRADWNSVACSGLVGSYAGQREVVRYSQCNVVGSVVESVSCSRGYA